MYYVLCSILIGYWKSDRYYKIVEKLEDTKKSVDEYNKNTPVEDRPVTCDGGMTYSAAGTVCGDSKKN